MAPRKLVLYISMSLDGYISTLEDDLSWLSIVENQNEDYGYSEFTQQVDTYIVGRKTYEVVMELCGGKFPPANQYTCYVITRENREPSDGITFFNGSLLSLVQELKQQEGKDIYCDGGGQIVHLLMQENLIDEYIISVIPTILGNGKRLFQGGITPISIQLISSKQYESGLVQLHYKKSNP